MKMQISRLFVSTVLLLSGAVQAIEPDVLMSRAMRDGKASGELTGSLAESIKARTRSTSPTSSTIEKVGDAGGGCQFFRVTVIQPDIPTIAGGNAGDFVTVSRTKVCPVTGQGEPLILECRIGKLSCMPSKALSSSKTP